MIPRLLLALLSLGLTIAVNAEDINWTLRKDKNGIQVYSREVADSRYKEFRTTVKLPVSQASTLALLNDVDVCSQWLLHCEHSSILKQTSTIERYIYQVSDLPFPVKSRDVIFKAVASQQNETTIQVELYSVPDYIELTNNVRIRDAYGDYRVERLSQTETLLTWTQFIDPAGFIPAFMVNSLLTDVPFKSLTKFRELVSTPRYQHAKFVYTPSGQAIALEN